MHTLSLFAQTYEAYRGGYRPAADTTAQLSPETYMTIMVVTLLLIVVLYVIHAYFMGKLFKKAGVQSWKAWVPIYNNWVMLELGDQKGLWAALAIIPIVNIVSAVFMYIAMYRIGLKLGKDGLFVVLAIFLPTVWIIWLGIDNSTWRETPMVVPTANT